MRGKIGGAAYVIAAIPEGLDGSGARKRRQEQYWARRGGNEVTTGTLTPEELAERKAAAQAKRAPTAPAGLRKAPARAEKITAEKPADAEQHIEDLLERIFEVPVASFS